MIFFVQSSSLGIIFFCQSNTNFTNSLVHALSRMDISFPPASPAPPAHHVLNTSVPSTASPLTPPQVPPQ